MEKMLKPVISNLLLNIDYFKEEKSIKFLEEWRN